MEIPIQLRLFNGEVHLPSRNEVITTTVIQSAIEISGFNPLEVASERGLTPSGLVVVPTIHSAGDPLTMTGAIGEVHPGTEVTILSQYPVVPTLQAPHCPYLVVSGWQVAKAYTNGQFSKLADLLKFAPNVQIGKHDVHTRYQLLICSQLHSTVSGVIPPAALLPLRQGMLGLFNDVIDHRLGIAVLEEAKSLHGNQTVYSVWSRINGSHLAEVGRIYAPI